MCLSRRAPIAHFVRGCQTRRASDSQTSAPPSSSTPKRLWRTWTETAIARSTSRVPGKSCTFLTMRATSVHGRDHQTVARSATQGPVFRVPALELHLQWKKTSKSRTVLQTARESHSQRCSNHVCGQRFSIVFVHPQSVATRSTTDPWRFPSARHGIELLRAQQHKVACAECPRILQMSLWRRIPA